MKSKFLKYYEHLVCNQGSGADAWFDIEEVFTKMEELLRRSMHSTDNENLHDEIRSLLDGIS